MAGGSPSSQTVTNRTEVDPVTQAWRSGIMGAGGQLYNQGTAAYYLGNTVVPFSNQTQSGLDYLTNYASQGAPGLQEAQGAMSQAMSGWNPAMPMAMGAAQGSLYGNPATQALQGYGNADNPYLRGLFDQGASQVSDAVNANFARAGRSGPNAAHTGALTRGIGELYNQIYTPAYEAERNRGLSAAQTMGGLFDSGANRTLQGIGMAGDMYGQGQTAAARAAALLPGLYNYGMMPGQSMMDVGGIYEGLAGDYLNADRQRYDYNANAPWANLQRYAGLMTGLPDFSSQTQTTTGPGTNRLMSGLGGGMAGAGIASSLGLTGPWGWGLAGLGSLAGIFG